MSVPSIGDLDFVALRRRQFDFDLHAAGDRLRCAYSTDAAAIGTEIEVTNRGAIRAVSLTIPAGGFVIFEP